MTPVDPGDIAGLTAAGIHAATKGPELVKKILEQAMEEEDHRRYESPRRVESLRRNCSQRKFSALQANSK